MGYTFFSLLTDLIITGPAGTNVGDLQVFLRWPSPAPGTYKKE